MKLLNLLLYLAPVSSYIGNKTKVKFDGGCLKQDKLLHSLYSWKKSKYVHYLWNKFVELCKQ